MLIAEYSYETDIKVQRREAYREGLAEGIEQGAEQTKIETAKKLFFYGTFFRTSCRGNWTSVGKSKRIEKCLIKNTSIIEIFDTSSLEVFCINFL